MLLEHLSQLGRNLIPRICPLCLAHADDSGLCKDCLSELPTFGHCCRICLAPLTPQAGAVCARCTAGVIYDRIRAVSPYIPPLSHLISQFKYRKELKLSKTLATLLATAVTQHNSRLPDLLLPVPLHRQRIRQRGFNQAVEIGRALSAQLKIPLDSACVCKVKKTPPQTALSKRQRQQNIKGAFRLRYVPEVKSVAIVDDVMTTGATVVEIASLLKRSGVQHVEAWVLARTTAFRQSRSNAINSAMNITMPT